VSEGRPQAGWRQAVLVLGVVLDVVLVGASITLVVPPLRDAVLHTPLTIAVLVVGTVLVLWRLAARPPAA
jgi:heme A synthase